MHKVRWKMQVNLNNKVQNALLWFFLLAISVVFIFWGSVGLRFGGAQYLDINGEKIYSQELNAFRRVYPEANLVQVTLGLQELSKIGFSFSSEQVDNVVKNLPIFQSNGKFSNELYQGYLSQNISEVQAIRKGAYFNSLIQQMTFAMQQAVVIFPNTTENYYKLMDQKRNVSLLTIDSSKFLNEIVSDETELKNYYDNNRDRYAEPEQVKLEFIKIYYPDIVSQITLNNEDIEQYYNENIDQFTKPGKKKLAQIVVNMKAEGAKEKLDTIQQKLADNAEFGDIAKSYSDDSLTSKKQGDAGWFQAGDIGDAELEQAINTLKTPGDISTVVTYNNKWYLFKLLEQRKSEVMPLAEVSADIKTKLSEQKANTIYSDLKEKLERKSFEISDNLAMVADELSVKTAETDWLNKNGLIKADLNAKDIVDNPKVIEIAFSEDVLENRNNSPLIELNAESAVVLRIKDYKPSRTKNYIEVKNEIEKSVKEIKAKQKAKDYAFELWKNFVNNTSALNNLEAVSRNSKYAQYHQPKDVSYLDTFWGSEGEFKQEFTLAFDLPKPSKDYPLQAKLLSLDNGNQSILAVDKVTLGEYAKASAEQKEQTSNQLKYYMLMRDNTNFFNRILANAKIKNYM